MRGVPVVRGAVVVGAVAVEVPFVQGDEPVGVVTRSGKAHRQRSGSGERAGAGIGRGRVAHLNGHGVLGGQAVVVRHADSRVVEASGKELRGGVRRGRAGIIVGAVAVEIPFVQNDGPVRVVGRGRKVDGQRRLAQGRGRQGLNRGADSDDDGCRIRHDFSVGIRHRERHGEGAGGLVDLGKGLTGIVFAPVSVGVPRKGVRRCAAHHAGGKRHGQRYSAGGGAGVDGRLEHVHVDGEIRGGQPLVAHRVLDAHRDAVCSLGQRIDDLIAGDVGVDCGLGGPVHPVDGDIEGTRVEAGVIVAIGDGD